jgi:alkylated DNA repair dioxygenase AlkB
MWDEFARSKAMATGQLGLFGEAPAGPDGFLHRADFVSPDEERELAAQIAGLPFRAFEFQGFTGKRRVVSFGWRYDFNHARLEATEPLPEFLLPLRDRAAGLAGVEPEAFAHALVTEYGPGAAIGWHRDRPDFEQVVGASLLSPCTFRFRRRAETGWERISIPMEPRSAYLLTGQARNGWEHSIPPVEGLRYSVTFRSLRNRGPDRRLKQASEARPE